MRALLIVLGLMMSVWAYADDESMMDLPPEREPNAVMQNNAAKRTYPGAADEEDLQVQTRLPEATLKTDARSLQRVVYKSLYNQEMKDERTENVEE